MQQLINPGRLGILGGGQLARMTLQAAISLGVDVAVLAEAADSPAGRLTQHEFVGAWDDMVVLQAFADAIDVVTLENEFVDAAILAQLAAWEKPVRPDAGVLQVIQDKLLQKQRLAEHGLPVPPFAAVDTADDILRAANEWGWPLILKARRNGYDGYGNATLNGPYDLDPALRRLGWPERTLFVEQAIPFERELAVLVARGIDGDSVTYPVVETVQRDHICHIVRAPAPIKTEMANVATAIAHTAVQAVDGLGITAVELFQTADGILINELAPRPHNSGHFSIDACHTSQFENHLRAVLGLPLGDAGLRVGAAVMVNLLGTRNGPARPAGLADALRVPNIHIHIYGKREVRQGRKMGHITGLGDDLRIAEERALEAARILHL